jgi:3-dehydroquinate dehydratase type I
MNRPDLPDLLKGQTGNILVTNRRREEGGAYTGAEAQRVKHLEEAVTQGADFVDIEAATDPVLVGRLKAHIASRGNRTKIILSWHDFSGTPGEQALKMKLRSMTAIGADIIKIVTFANKMEDNLNVLNLIPYARRRGQEIITFCMGDLGRPSRVLATLLGSYWTYASLERGAESAPGQMTVDEMKKIWEIITP